QVKRLSTADFPVPVEPVEHLRIPRNFNSRNPKDRADLVATMHNKLGGRDLGPPPRVRDHAVEDEEIARLRREIRRHPCHGCDEREDHARWAERYHRLLRETEALRRRVESRSHVIARTFDRVCAVLTVLGYLEGEPNAERVTVHGRRLAKLYTELDLLTAECLRQGLWEDLDYAELAACVSCLVYETRQDDTGTPRLPTGAATRTMTEMVRLWGELEAVEKEHGLSFLREPDFGFAWVAWRWAKGHSLDAVLLDADLAAGDFVRQVKQLVDLLDQIREAAPQNSNVRVTANQAIEAMHRGVVAYSSLA